MSVTLNLFSNELLKFLASSNCVYIIRLKNGLWYIGSVIDFTLFTRLKNHSIFSQQNFHSLYGIINVQEDVCIDAAIIERVLQNYVSDVLKVCKNRIYKCGAQGFVCSEDQIIDSINHILFHPYLQNFVTFDNDTLGLLHFKQAYAKHRLSLWNKLVVNGFMDPYKAQLDRTSHKVLWDKRSPEDRKVLEMAKIENNMIKIRARQIFLVYSECDLDLNESISQLKEKCIKYEIKDYILVHKDKFMYVYLKFANKNNAYYNYGLHDKKIDKMFYPKHKILESKPKYLNEILQYVKSIKDDNVLISVDLKVDVQRIFKKKIN
jgi:hypothetical protein